MECTCQNCGTTFVVNAFRAPTVKYCSVACKNEGLRIHPREKACEHCGVMFPTRHPATKFCSADCRSRHPRAKDGWTVVPPGGHKTCTTCRETKPVEMFPKSGRSKDGYRYDCIACTQARVAKGTSKTGPQIPDGFKRCTRCHQIKPIESGFHRSGQASCGYNPRCKACAMELQRAYIAKRGGPSKQRSREAYFKDREKNLDGARRRRQEHLAWWESIQGNRVCIHCGETHPACLDYHHRDPSTKTHNLSRMIRSSTKEAILAEIAKCDVLCSNCHRKLHWTGQPQDRSRIQMAKAREAS